MKKIIPFLIILITIILTNGTINLDLNNKIAPSEDKWITTMSNIFNFSVGLITTTMNKMRFSAAELCINSLQIPVNIITLILKLINHGFSPTQFEIIEQITNLLNFACLENCKREIIGWGIDLGFTFYEYYLSPKNCLIQISINILVNGKSSYAALRRIIEYIQQIHISDWRAFGVDFGVLVFNIFLDDNWI